MIAFPKAYAVYEKIDEIVENSSSGGVFYSIASFFILQLEGVVYGATIENGEVFHKRVDKLNDLLPLMKSKYVMSDIRNTFKECSDDLQMGKAVLYVSTPCLIAALKNYLNKSNVNCEKLLTGDVFCHGAPLKKYWSAYLAEKYHNIIINNVNFRKKKPSWENYSLEINNKTVSFHKDEYFSAFLNNYILGENCYNCKYKGENRFSDFSIGDFWGINYYYPELYRKKGITLLIIRNKESFLLNIINQSCKISIVDYGLSISGNPAYFSSVKKPDNLDDFLNDFRKRGFLYAVNKNIPKKKKRLFVAKKVFRFILALFGFSKSKKRENIDKIINIKSVGIITDDGYRNFGNRLQNYALSEILRKNGYEPINLWYDNFKRFSLYRFIEPIFRPLYKFLYSPTEARKQKKIKQACLLSGEKKMIFSYSPQNRNRISYFKNIILGSDQIWNHTYNFRRIPYNLGLFGDTFKGRVFSYAASFGTDYIPSSFDYIYYYGLSKIYKIGVREYKGLNIINDLGFSAVINLDPTLLLDTHDWNLAIHSYSKIKIPKKYLLFYSLGGTCKNRQDAQDLAIKNSLLFVDASDKKSQYYCINHFDFINLIKNAEIVYTNSFHAFAFSYIFKNRLYLFKKQGMNSRFETFFSIIQHPVVYDKLIDLSILNNNSILKLSHSSILYILSSLS